MVTTQAKKYLVKSDPHMAGLVRHLNVDHNQQRKNNFRSLVGLIISQRLSAKAATTIKKRFQKILGFDSYSSKHILKASIKELRNAGLSRSKVNFIKGLAAAKETGQLNFRKFELMENEQIIQELTQHKGVGRWTAEMFLIFSLGRKDVFSLGDSGLKSAIRKIYKPENSDPKNLLKIAENWRPYRSIASLYLWASLDNLPQVKHIKKTDKYYFYMLRCNDGTLYSGITNNLKRREAVHNSGKGSAYVRSRGGGKIVYWGIVPTRGAALRRESELKKLKKSEKEILVRNKKIDFTD